MKKNFSIYYLIGLAILSYMVTKDLAIFYKDVDWQDNTDVIAYMLFAVFSLGILGYLIYSFMVRRRLEETFLIGGERKIKFNRTWPWRFAIFGALFVAFSANLILQAILALQFSYLVGLAIFVLFLGIYFLVVAIMGWGKSVFISFKNSGLDISGVGFVAWPQVERISLSHTAIAVSFKQNAAIYNQIPKWKSFICGYSTYTNDKEMAVYMPHLWRLQMPSLVKLLFQKEYAIYLGHQIFESDHEEELIERAIAEKGQITFDDVPYQNVQAVKTKPV